MTLLLCVGFLISLPIRGLAYVAGIIYASVSQGFRRGQIRYHLEGPLHPEASGWKQATKSDSLKQMKNLT